MIAIQLEVVGGEQLLASFTQIEAVVDNLTPVFEALSDEVFADIQKRIDNHPGPPLAPSTVKRKGHARILRDKDDLYGSFQKGAAGNIIRIRPQEAEFGTSDPKAMFHQEGTARMPKRTIIEITGGQEAKYARIATDVLIERIRELGFEIA